MRCRECQAILPAFIEGDLGSDERQAVAEHLQACPDCQLEHSLLLGSIKAVKGMEPVRAPRGFSQGLRRRLMAESRPLWYRRQGWSLAAAACLALILVSWPLWLNIPGAPDLLLASESVDNDTRSVGLMSDPGDSAPEAAADMAMSRLSISATLRVEEVGPALSAISAFVIESGGHVDHGAPTPDGFDLVVVIPDDRLYAALRHLEGLGSLRWDYVEGLDLKEDYLAARESVSALEQMVEARSGDLSVEDLATLVEKLAQARARLERVIQADSEVRIDINLGQD